MGSHGNTAGSGGRVRRGLEGKGPTPKAEDRVYHAAHKAKQAVTRRPASIPKPARTTSPANAADWVVGRNAVLEALQVGLPVKIAYVAEGAERDSRLRDIFALAANQGLALLEVTRRELDRVTGGAVHQGIALKLPPFEYAHPDDVLSEAALSGAIVVACDHITDPHNLGAIIRSAAGFGSAGVVLPTRRSAQMTAAAWKASAGAAARLPVAKASNLNQALERFSEAGFTIVGLTGDGDTDMADVPATDRLVLVVGAEGSGLSRLVRQHCDVLARIPIASDLESLNVSVATGIALYALSHSQSRGPST
jgi:23S rRNA (guanosine2251-2'-O)-methyltransferase